MGGRDQRPYGYGYGTTTTTRASTHDDIGTKYTVHGAVHGTVHVRLRVRLQVRSSTVITVIVYSAATKGGHVYSYSQKL